MRLWQWRRDSADLHMIVEARGISRQAALNALAEVMRRKKAGPRRWPNGFPQRTRTRRKGK